MPINYTVREVTVNSVTVDYDDGSWAIVPLKSSYTKEQAEEIISQFVHTSEPYDSVDAVPFTAGESNTVKTQQEKAAEAKAASDAMLMGYAELRASSYPSIGDQFDALYWARNGDDTKQSEIDAKIAAVKADYPKDMAPITRAEYNAVIAAAAE